MSTYLYPPRETTVTARVTRADRRLLEAAAEARRATISAYVADAAMRAARRDLGIGRDPKIPHLQRNGDADTD